MKNFALDEVADNFRQFLNYRFRFISDFWERYSDPCGERYLFCCRCGIALFGPNCHKFRKMFSKMIFSRGCPLFIQNVAQVPLADSMCSLHSDQSSLREHLFAKKLHAYLESSINSKIDLAPLTMFIATARMFPNFDVSQFQDGITMLAASNGGFATSRSYDVPTFINFLKFATNVDSFESLRQLGVMNPERFSSVMNELDTKDWFSLSKTQVEELREEVESGVVL